MGEPLGKEFSALWQELAWLFSKWSEYLALFDAGSSRIDIMKNSAPLFFRLVQDSLFEGVILQIARLTDPPRTGTKENLTIKRLPTMVDDEELERQLEEAIEEVMDATEFCRDWRNRRFAHRDLRLAIEDGITPLLPASRVGVTDALTLIAKVLNLVQLFYKDSSTIFDLPNSYGGAVSVLYVIDDGLRLSEYRTDRITTGEEVDSVLQIRDI